MSVEDFGCDVRLAWRGLARAKAFSVATILTLALGIAGTTLMFTLVRGVLLRPLPVHDQERLIVAWKELRSSGFSHHPFGDLEIEAVGRESQLIEAVAGADANGAGRAVVTENGTSSYVNVAIVTGRFFEVLGVNALLGRPLGPADDVEEAENVVAISHALWTRRYGRASDIIGRGISIDQKRFTIVGVMPSDVDHSGGAEIWRTTRSFGTTGPFGDAARREIDLIARLRPGVSLEQVTSELAALTRQFDERALPGRMRDLVPVVRSYEQAMVGNVRAPLVALLAAVALVLLIATANVANLFLMQGEARRSELAVREAVGADRWRIVRELLVESLTLSLLAAVAGLAFTWWSLQALLALVPDGLPRLDSIRVDMVVVAFTAAIACATCCLASVAPAVWLRDVDLVSQLRGGDRGATSPAARRGRRGLVVAQVALAVLVVAAAGLIIRSLVRLQSADTGFAAPQLVFVELTLPAGTYDSRARHAQFLEQTIASLEAAPAIAAATPVNVMPFSGDGGWDVPRFTAEGQGADRAASNPALNLESIFPNYFASFGISLTHGRAFTTADRQGSVAVAILSDDVAARLWPGTDPVGRRIKMGGPDSDQGWLTVVGVATSTRYRELARPRPTLYLPAAQFQMTARMLVVRTTAPLELVSRIAREQIRNVDPNVQVVQVSPYARALARPLARPRFNAFLLGAFSTAALLLSAIGLYAVMSAFVRQRDREIAVRLALGATSAHVRRLVLGETGRLAGLGVLTGLVIAVVATTAIRGAFHDVVSLDPLMLLAAAAVLIAVSMLVSLVPMRRALRVDAVAVLRQ
jgi:predicted permease